MSLSTSAQCRLKLISKQDGINCFYCRIAQYTYKLKKNIAHTFWISIILFEIGNFYNFIPNSFFLQKLCKEWITLLTFLTWHKIVSNSYSIFEFPRVLRFVFDSRPSIVHFSWLPHRTLRRSLSKKHLYLRKEGGIDPPPYYFPSKERGRRAIAMVTKIFSLKTLGTHRLHLFLFMESKILGTFTAPLYSLWCTEDGEKGG